MDERARRSKSFFLEPQPYRRRRLIDAIRLLPVFGIFLFVLPPALLPQGVPGVTSGLLLYLAGLWVALLICAAWVGRQLMRSGGLSDPLETSQEAPLDRSLDGATERRAQIPVTTSTRSAPTASTPTETNPVASTATESNPVDPNTRLDLGRPIPSTKKTP